MKIYEAIEKIKAFCPEYLACEWDNPGLQIGKTKDFLTGIYVTLDVTPKAVEDAIKNNCNLIVSHHPLLFRGLKQITGSTPQERCVLKAIQHNIAIYSAHTSMDSWLHGVSGKMAEKLGVQDYRILVESQDNVGLGVIGQLSEPMSMQACMAHVAKVFDIEGAGLRYVHGKGEQVQKVAICGGAGADLVNEAIAQGADAYVSADFKYHELQAVAGQIAVVDMDHWVSEQYTREIFEQLLSPYIHTRVAKEDKSPVEYWR